MQVTVTIHEAWLDRPEDLRRVMTLLAGLEVPPPGPASAKAARPAVEPNGYDPREDYEEPFYPEGRAPARQPAGSGRRLGTPGGGSGRGRARGTGGSSWAGRRSRSRT